MPSKTRKQRPSKSQVMKQLKKVGSILDKIGFATKKGTYKVYRKGKKTVMEFKKTIF